MNPEEAPTCATCKHWDRHRPWTKQPVDVGTCSRITDAPSGQPSPVDLGGDAWWDPVTRADFGCILHEPLPPADPGVPS